MGVTRTHHYESKVFPAGQLSRVFDGIRRSFLGEESAAEVSLLRTLADGTEHSEHGLPLSALGSICDLVQESVRVTVVGGDSVTALGHVRETFRVRLIATRDDLLSVVVETKDTEQLSSIIEALQEGLDLASAPLPGVHKTEARQDPEDHDPLIMQTLGELETRLALVEQRLLPAPDPLTCFLSFQFSAVPEAYAHQVHRFLELLGVRVVTGQGYEPQPVNQKVRQRLNSGIDFVVLIEVAEHKSAWTRDEIARTQGSGGFLIPLVEVGGSFDPGIYGDHEFISFAPGHIGDCFLGLLEGIRYIERARQARNG